MKLPDVNLLIYAVDSGSVQHERARAWLEEVLSGTEEVVFAWAVLLGFVRVSTNGAAFAAPLSIEEALEHVAEWLGQPMAATVAPGSGHVALLRELLEPLGAAGNLTSDAHLAALAIEHGAELCSADSDFGRFGAGLRWTNPLG